MKRTRFAHLRAPDFTDDPHYPAAVERAKEAVRKLQEAGITDAEGRRIRTDLPFDMRESSDDGQ